MPAEPIRLYDYTYLDWYTLAHKNQPGWTEDQFDASWDEHIQYRVWTESVDADPRQS